MKYLFLLLFGGAVMAAPQGGSPVVGQASINNTGVGEVTVTQQTERLAINWQSFDLSAAEKITFNQPSASAIALNRINNGTASLIDGSILANGNVFIVNPHGVVFGNNASINVGGLLVSDMDVDLNKFALGENVFIDNVDAAGGLENKGSITANNGDIVFMGQRMINSGELTTAAGDIYILAAAGGQYASGSATELTASIPVAVTTLPEGSAWFENSGSVVSTGGNIHVMSYHSADISRALINNQGQVVANRLAGQGGQLLLTDTQFQLHQIESLLVTETTSVQFIEGQADTQSAGHTVTQYFQDCDPDKDKDCKKAKAVQGFLESLTVGGQLPEAISP